MRFSIRHQILLLGLAVAMWTALGLPARATHGARVTADEPQYLLSALSLGNTGDLDIADELEAEDYRPFHAVDLPPQSYPDANGRQLSPHDPLLPVLLAVPMKLGGWLGAKVAMAMLAAITTMLTAWVAVRRFSVRPGIALPCIGAFSASAPMATYATQIYPEIPAALAVVVGVAVITASPHDRRWRHQLLGAITVVTLPWLSVKYVPVAGSLAALLLWQARSRRWALVGIFSLLAMAGAAYLVVHRQMYGGWTSYATGDAFVAGGEFSVVGTHPSYLGRTRRLVGLLVDRSFGIGVWMPGWLFLPFAIGAALRSRRNQTAALLIPLVIGWLVATFAAFTMHGWWFPGRQLVVVLPLGAIAIAWALDRADQNIRRLFVVASIVGLVSWLWITFEATHGQVTLVADFEKTTNPWFRLLQTTLPDGRTDRVADLVGTIGLGIVLAGTAIIGWRKAPPEDSFGIPESRS